ncbi:venom allergen 5 [Contarinia nasturtii]|uniref:venom allergen 5 n=1 Tax=Contarinia nasturtii TaxID=265458 RepID=UPI0012D486AF|nr:venom allergen 5 [Contarinia nasturtii]
MDKFNGQSTVICLFIVAAAFVGVTESLCRGSLITTGITEAQKYEILDTHNRLRSQVAQGQIAGQPSAQNMREMQWDDELALRAQQWANECYFEHDPSRYTNRFTMGQNLAIVWSTAPLTNYVTFSSRIQNWFNEVQKYAWGDRWSPKTGHYSQLVWGDTNLVGCGFSYYQEGARFNKLWVCNYGPGGNVVGHQPYAVGAPSCSNHGMYPSSKYSGLCVSTQTVYTNNQVITQNTYTIKTERINPTVYQPVQARPTYTTYQQPQTTAIQAYQQALQVYQNPNQSYEQAQHNYQLALAAYNRAYPSAATSYTYTPSISTSGSTTSNQHSYDWSAYFG